jgi:hypothetical protein
MDESVLDNKIASPKQVQIQGWAPVWVPKVPLSKLESMSQELAPCSIDLHPVERLTRPMNSSCFNCMTTNAEMGSYINSNLQQGWNQVLLSCVAAGLTSMCREYFSLGNHEKYLPVRRRRRCQYHQQEQQRQSLYAIRYPPTRSLPFKIGSRLVYSHLADTAGTRTGPRRPSFFISKHPGRIAALFFFWEPCRESSSL